MLLVISLLILLVNGGPNQHPSKEAVRECFKQITVSFEREDIGDISDDYADKMASSLPISFLNLCQDIEWIADMYKKLVNNNEEELENRERRRLQLLADDLCIADNTVFCEASTVIYSDGSYYEELLAQLHGHDQSLLIDGLVSSYTDADGVSKLIDDMHDADIALGIAEAGCSALVECAGIDQTGILACAAATACETGMTIAQLLVYATRILLDKADTHDHVLMSTQLTSIFEDRKRIISNQKYLNTQINIEFDELTELNIKLFNLQNNWLNTKFNDLFYQLNTLDKLIRTPSGQIPGWNDQIGLDTLFVEPTDIEIPQSDDDDEINI